MNVTRGTGITAAQKRRPDESALCGIRTEDIGAIGAEDGFGFLLEASQLLPHFPALRQRGYRPHAHPFHPWITDSRLRELGLKCIQQRGSLGHGHQRPPDRRAFLPSLDRHFARHFADVQIEFRRPRYRVRTQDRRVQRVRLRGKSH